MPCFKAPAFKRIPSYNTYLIELDLKFLNSSIQKKNDGFLQIHILDSAPHYKKKQIKINHDDTCRTRHTHHTRHTRYTHRTHHTQGDGPSFFSKAIYDNDH